MTFCNLLLSLAPCPAADLSVEVDCNNDMAQFFWSWSDGAHSYQVTATGSDGALASCETEENSCNVTGLQCGQTYNVSLRAINDNCQTEDMGGDVTFSTREYRDNHWC